MAFRILVSFVDIRSFCFQNIFSKSHNLLSVRERLSSRRVLSVLGYFLKGAQTYPFSGLLSQCVSEVVRIQQYFSISDV